MSAEQIEVNQAIDEKLRDDGLYELAAARYGYVKNVQLPQSLEQGGYVLDAIHRPATDFWDRVTARSEFERRADALPEARQQYIERYLGSMERLRDITEFDRGIIGTQFNANERADRLDTFSGLTSEEGMFGIFGILASINAINLALAGDSTWSEFNAVAVVGGYCGRQVVRGWFRRSTERAVQRQSLPSPLVPDYSEVAGVLEREEEIVTQNQARLFRSAQYAGFAIGAAIAVGVNAIPGISLSR